ncbi:MAG: hypothetical protein WCJ30_01480 [Deltaproteobacteria bacterium]
MTSNNDSADAGEVGDAGELARRLANSNMYDALEVVPSPRSDDLERAIASLRERIPGLGVSPGVETDLTARLDVLAGLVARPLERAIHARAISLRLDISDPSNREILETESLEGEVWRLLAVGGVPEALPLAERWLASAPDSVSARAAVAWARAVAGPESGREEAAAMARALALESPKCFEAQIAVAYISTAEGRLDRARPALAAARVLSPRDEKVAALEHTLATTPPRNVEAVRPFLSFDLNTMPKGTRTAIIVAGVLLVARLLLLPFGI